MLARLLFRPCAPLFLLGVFVALGPYGGAQQQSSRGSGASEIANDTDPTLARIIAETPAIDNHAHPMLSPPADAADREFDALPVDNMEPQTDPVAWRTDWPQLAEAWKALYGFTGIPPLDADGQKRLEAARRG